MKAKNVARHVCWLLLPALLLLAGCADKKKQAAELLKSADSDFQNRKFDAAIDDYTKAIELTPDDPLAYLDRGEVKFAAKGDFDGAIVDYSKAILLQHDYDTAFAYRATAEQAKGDTAKALADWSQVIAIHPIPAHYEQRGTLRQLTGDFAGAVEDYQKAQSSLKVPLLQLRCYTLLRRLGRDPGNLDQVIADVTNPWAVTIARYLTGLLSETDFLATADKGSPADVAGQQCQANYFVGEMHLANHDPAGARAFFSQSAALNESQAEEYQFARAELALLDKVPGQSASPALNSLMDNSPYGERSSPLPSQ